MNILRIKNLLHQSIAFRLTAVLFFLQFSLFLFSKTPVPLFADSLTVNVDSIVQPTCLNGGDGAIFITANGGTAPYTYLWSNGSNGDDLVGVSSGTYSVTVTDSDANQVSIIGLFVPQTNNPLVISHIYTLQPGCAGQLGALAVEVGGGTPPYNLIWSNGETTDSIFNLTAGNYSLQVEDANGCTANFNYNLQPLEPIANIVEDGDITCAHLSTRLDGTASLFTPNTSFEWIAPLGVVFDSPSDSLVVFTSAEGTYSLILTDTLNGCVSATSIVIEIDTLKPQVNAGPDLNLACSNSIESLFGNVLVGPSHHFMANWTALDGGILLADADSLTAVMGHSGTYILTVGIQENGCTATDTTIVAGMNEAPSLNVGGGTIDCNNPSVQLTAQIDSLNTVFGWTGPNGFISGDLEPIVSDSGIYLLTLSDTITNCYNTAEAIVLENTEAPVIAATGGTINCLNHSLNLGFSSSSTDISAQWVGPNGFVSNELSPNTIFGGNYTLTVTDTINGCTAIDIATVVMDTIHPIADAGANSVLTCAITSLEIGGPATTQGPTMMYDWSTINGHFVGDTHLPNPTVDEPGVYYLTVTNAANSCQATDEVTITKNTVQPTVGAQGGTITCALPSVVLQGSFSPSHSIFSWTGPLGFASNQQNPSVSQGGTYVFTVTDTVNGCSKSASTVVAVSTNPPSLQTAGGIIGCNPPNLTIHAYTQTNNVTFFWAGPGGFFSNLQHPVVTLPGNYSVTLTNTQNGCTTAGTAVVTQNTTPPIAVAGSGYVLGCAITSIGLSGVGSTQGIGISYLWTTTNGNIVSGANTLSPVVNAPGTYTLKVTNNLNGCTAIATTTVTQAPPLVLFASSTDATCNGFPSGTATAMVTGGSGNISYLWSNGMQTPMAVGLFAGTYTVTVNDATGCVATASTTIGQPATALSINVSATPQTMPGQNNGTASVVASGGNPFYLYNWSNGANTATITGLAPGAYTVTVTDQNFCTAFSTANVNAASCALSGTVTTTNIACFGNSSGSATVSASNAAAPIQYQWSNGSNTTSPSINGLVAGQYTVTVIDNAGCSIVLNFQITQPSAALSVTELSHTNVACATGTNNGSVTVTANGGTSPYTYAWSNGGNTATINNLGVGNYNLTVTDNKGCTKTFSTAITNSDTQPPVLVLKNLTVNLNTSGQATVTAAQFNNGSTDNCGIASWTASQLTFNCNHLGTNTVTVTVTDVNGLQSTGSAQVIVEDHVSPTLNCPSNISMTAACGANVNFNLPTVNDNCSVNMAQLNLVAGLPSGSMFPAGTTTQTFSYTDASGNTGTCSFQVSLSNSLSVNATIDHVSCANACDGTIQLTTTGGQQPLNIIWGNGGDGNNLCAGNYNVSVVDGSGCSHAFSYTVNQPSPLAVSMSQTEPSCPNEPIGTAQAFVSGGNSPYNFSWSNGSNGQSISGLTSGTYTVTVSDSNGCLATGSATINANDTEAPTLNLHNANLAIGANGMATVFSALIDAGSFDNCGIANWVISPNSFNCTQIGQQVVNVMAIDQNGNTSNGSVFVTITDNVAPTLNCPSNMTVGYCDPVANFNLPTITDNCTVDMTALVQSSGLPSGANFPVGTTTQTYKYTDASGNQGTCSFTVTVSTSTVLSSLDTDATCNGTCNGSAEIQHNGGQAPFVILWEDGTTGTTNTDLCAGIYQASVTDGNGCVETITVEIGEPTALLLLVDSVENDVNNTGSGSIEISVTGGTAPYTFSWTLNGTHIADSQNLTGISAGDYSVLVADANGCAIWSNVITVENSTNTWENTSLNQISLYPNPAANFTELVFSEKIQGKIEVTIFDALGKLATHQAFDQSQSYSNHLDLMGLAPGIYHLKISVEGRVGTKRLVVAK